MLDAQAALAEACRDEIGHQVEDRRAGTIADRVNGDVPPRSDCSAGQDGIDLAQPQCAARVTVTERFMHRRGVAAKAPVTEPLQSLPPDPGSGFVQ